jgi:ABC-type multidrug transport system fused ATPase/permease subunit
LPALLTSCLSFSNASLQLLAEANSAAAEALGNIRTVRAFSTEELELTKYQNKTLAAMTKGVTDAFAYSFAVAINNWLDLGASVLILWCVQEGLTALDLCGVKFEFEYVYEGVG